MWTEEKLNELLATPSEALVADMAKLDGDLMVLGAGGKMGPTLCLLARRADQRAGIKRRIYAVSRFSDPIAAAVLEENGIELIRHDLRKDGALEALPDAENVIYMAGRKFGTDGSEWQTWDMNATLPALVARRYQSSRIVAFSSGNLYPLVSPHTGGCAETDRPSPVGEYAMSCLARERAFEYAANTYGTRVLIYRLNFAVDLRYGVLYDIAQKVRDGEPVSLATPAFNCIWQGSANEIALRGLLHAANPVEIVNVTGPETVSVRKTAEEFGRLFKRSPVFAGEEGRDAYLNNASKATELFGYPSVGIRQLIRWQAEWLLAGGRALGKPTHFEERKGSY